MANPWDSDPIEGGSPWDSDPEESPDPFPSDISPAERALRQRNLAGRGPKLSAGIGDRPLLAAQNAELATANDERTKRLRGTGWSEGSADTEDWAKIPRLGEFAMQGAMAGELPAIKSGIGAGISSLKGVPTAVKAAKIAKALGQGVVETGVGAVVNEGLKMTPLPADYRTALMSILGFTRAASIGKRVKGVLSETARAKALTAKAMSRAETQAARDAIKVEEAWLASQEKRAAEAAAKVAAERKLRGVAEGRATREGIKVENDYAATLEAAKKQEAVKAAMAARREARQRAVAEGQSVKDQLAVQAEWEKAQAARAKVGAPAEEMPLREARQRGVAEGQSVKDQMKVEEQWLRSQGQPPASIAEPSISVPSNSGRPLVTTATQFERDLINAGVAPKVAREMAASAGQGVPSDVAGRVEGASRRAVADGVGKSSVPKTDNVIEGDFIDPQYVSVVPPTPPAGQRAMATNLGGSARPGPAPTAPQDLEAALRQTLENAKSTGTLKAPSVPPNYESTAAQTRSVEPLRKEVGAVKAARKLGISKDQVNQVRLDAGDRGSEALGEAAGLPEGARRAIVSKLSSLKSREEVMDYIRRANNEKARLQIEGIAVGMGLL